MANSGITFAAAPMLSTRRLLLRAWREADLEPFAALNADPEVMRYFPFVHSREESDRVAQSIQNRFRSYGFGFWAIETVDTPFIGFVGLSYPNFEAPFSQTIEIGWRLAQKHWGKGYASEAARAALAFAFDRANAPEVVSFTPAINQRSIGVMERIGMSHDGYFEHPAIPEGPLKKFALYRLTKAGREAARSEPGER